MDNCNTCCYWNGVFGECHKNAPAPILASPEKEEYVLVWPKTKPTDYCGEYQEGDLPQDH